jgi:hypothetical protein
MGLASSALGLFLLVFRTVYEKQRFPAFLASLAVFPPEPADDYRGIISPLFSVILMAPAQLVDGTESTRSDEYIVPAHSILTYYRFAKRPKTSPEKTRHTARL